VSRSRRRKKVRDQKKLTGEKKRQETAKNGAFILVLTRKIFIATIPATEGQKRCVPHCFYSGLLTPETALIIFFIPVVSDDNSESNFACESLLNSEIFCLLPHPLRVDGESYFFLVFQLRKSPQNYYIFSSNAILPTKNIYPP